MANAAPLAGEKPQLPRSLWADISTPRVASRELEGGVTADVVVIGAGFAGCAAALTLAQAGARVVVLDAAEPGWGASGRNNGQVIPGLKFDPDDLERRFGAERGGKLVQWSGDAPNAVFDLIETHRIACAPVRKGWVQPAYTTRSAAMIASRCEQWARRGAPVEMLRTEYLAGILGTPVYIAGWIDSRGGTINPLSYARGLAATAIAAGARLYPATPALSLEQAFKSWIVRTPRGTVKAGRVFVATAAYADDLVEGLRRSMVPVRTAQVATAPLSDVQLRTILPGRQGASDTRRLLTSFRITPDSRLMMGGAWATGSLDDAHLLPRLHAVGRELFRHLGALQWEYGWSGFFPATDDHMPHLHETPEGLICALGCNGRGIALSTAMGRLVGERLLGKRVEEMPLEPSAMPAVRFHEFRTPGIAVATAFKGVQDRIDRALTRKPS
jgi:glycine/D-amino acid oxidase-like deaminating enzyme